MKTIAVIGEPAVGKTSTFKQIRKDGAVFKYRLIRGIYDKKREIYWLGVFDGSTFEGTDRLSMGVMTDAIAFVEHLAKERTGATVVFEGDRLGCVKFLTTAKEHGEVVVFHVSAPDPAIDARHIERADGQSPTWLKGRRTKIENLLAAFPAKEVLNSLDTSHLRLNAKTIADEAGAELVPEIASKAPEGAQDVPSAQDEAAPSIVPESKKRKRGRKGG
jgi:hypothetical protein